MLRKLSTLQLALIFSIGVHATLLAVRIVDPERFNRIFQDTPLEVILVNSRSGEPPEKAQAIAQAALAGGGEAQSGRATSPLPPSALVEVGEANEESRKRIEQLQEAQQQLLTQTRRELALLPSPEPVQEQQGSPEEQAQEEKRRQLIQQLAEIEKRINEENSRPKKRYISPATREEAYAIYYDALRRKVEDKGTENFPEQGGRKLYGELTMIVTVNHDGRVLGTEIVQGSGNSTLDRRAEAIARAAGPFGAFDAEMRKKADQIAMVARFKFTRDQTLETVVK
jgi:protein TonB